jgi:5-methylcytosine-specific restriction endonuclease McrA
VLLLNRFYVPVCVTNARRALVLLYAGSARALDDLGDSHTFDQWRHLPVRDGDDPLPIVAGVLRVPRVLHLQRYERMPRVSIRLTRRNLLLRDQQQCQYCGRRPTLRDLNVDHVRPRSRGGASTWENVVIACRACNLRKGHRTPEEAGMRLIRPPQRPKWSTTAHILMSAEPLLLEWRPFLKAG